MSAQENTANISGDPALLGIEGPVAPITLNRPAAFNSIDLLISKLEQLAAEVEADDSISGVNVAPLALAAT